MARGTRKADIRRLTPRRLSWFGWLMGRVMFATKIAALVAVVIGLGVWVLAHGYMNRAGAWVKHEIVTAGASAGLRVADVVVEGRHYLDADVLKNVIDVQPGDALLGVDVTALVARLNNLAWIKTATVRRVWPDRLMVTLEERIPVAIWLDAPGGTAVIDAEGFVLTRRNVPSYAPLLGVEGVGADTTAWALLQLLKGQPELAVLVKKAVRVSGRRWDLWTSSGTIVRLPEDDPGFALARAAKAQQFEKILEQNLKAIDLRQSDRIILERKPGDTGGLLLKGGNSV